MPRRANPKSNNQIIVRAKDEVERQKLKAFKEICVLDGLEYSREIFKLLEPFFRDHNWPPGNPQIQITKFGVQTEITQQCEYPGCSSIAAFECVPNSPLAKPKVFYCQKHYEHARVNRLLKKSKQL